MRRKFMKIAAGMVCAGMLFSACGETTKVENGEEAGNKTQTESTEQAAREQEMQTQKDEAASWKERWIKEQTFETELKPWGKVTFVSCAPDTEQEVREDVAFSVLQEGEKICDLPPMREGNLLAAAESFDSVEAVSFPDYNGDGNTDVLVVLQYSYVQGPDAGSGFTEVRVYDGTGGEEFELNRELSENATKMDGEKTIAGVLEQIKKNDNTEAVWRQAYLDYLDKECVQADNEGYALLYLDEDEIPELVEIGNCEAVGCRIDAYADGKVHVNQLNRLFFSYLRGQNLLCNSEGHMDNYYDIIYRLKNGELELVEDGYYGAEDNTNVQFDENDEPIYQYWWNNVSVTKEEYQNALNKVYDTKNAKPGYEWRDTYTLEELRACLAGTEDADKPAYEGNWVIDLYRTPGITALSQQEIEDIMFSEVSYDRTMFRMGETVIENPVYQEQELTAEEFAAEYNQAVTFEDLYTSREKVTKVTVENAEGIGSTFYVAGRHRLWIPWDGVFFMASDL